MRRASVFRHEQGEQVLRIAEREVSSQRRRGRRVEAVTEGEMQPNAVGELGARVGRGETETDHDDQHTGRSIRAPCARVMTSVRGG